MTLLEHPLVVITLCVALAAVSLVNVTWAFLKLRNHRRSIRCSCYLCREERSSSGVEKLWGFPVCRGCLLVYESLMYYAVVQNNENAREVLRLAGKKLTLFSLPVAAFSGRRQWRDDEKKKEQIES